MAEVQPTSSSTVECPHCHKPFEFETVQGKGRIRGFKCPHCRLFVPYDRVAEQALSRDPDA
jgi:tRNA(Ile2) C34 agmatinyltransferase TiaS